MSSYDVADCNFWWVFVYQLLFCTGHHNVRVPTPYNQLVTTSTIYQHAYQHIAILTNDTNTVLIHSNIIKAPLVSLLKLMVVVITVTTSFMHSYSDQWVYECFMLLPSEKWIHACMMHVLAQWSVMHIIWIWNSTMYVQCTHTKISVSR